MKIFFDNVNWSSSSGPNSFAQRIAEQLSLDGHIVADQGDYDIALVFIEETRALRNDKPKVQRLDGIWFKHDEYETKNKQIRACYDSADAVIWQSDFDKGMTTRWWGEPHGLGTVIRNGIKRKKVNVTSATIKELRSRYEKIFVCSANWHRQKRLKECVELFKHLRMMHPFSCLVIMGAGPDYRVADSNIYYTDSLPHEICLEMFSEADWFIHLAWADHSPNVVCEALSQNCPVICSETGGTKELVGSNGIILHESHEYKFELFDYENPPKIDVTQVKNLPQISVDSSAIDISLTSKAYIQLFEKIIQK